jgi:hypothetical protein
MSVLCSNCYQAIDTTCITPGETHSWCPHCRTTFRVPLLYVPEWIVGLIVILIINLQVNL